MGVVARKITKPEVATSDDGHENGRRAPRGPRGVGSWSPGGRARTSTRHLPHVNYPGGKAGSEGKEGKWAWLR
eukprot:scaffold102017_cov29-Tisochrysis_lutea.AAC.1